VDWSEWEEVARNSLPRGPRDQYEATFVVLERKGLARQASATSA
jgi:hypothetical protein